MSTTDWTTLTRMRVAHLTFQQLNLVPCALVLGLHMLSANNIPSASEIFIIIMIINKSLTCDHLTQRNDQRHSVALMIYSQICNIVNGQICMKG